MDQEHGAGRIWLLEPGRHTAMIGNLLARILDGFGEASLYDRNAAVMRVARDGVPPEDLWPLALSIGCEPVLFAERIAADPYSRFPVRMPGGDGIAAVELTAEDMALLELAA